jgi:BlaI family penicillinase repressor
MKEYHISESEWEIMKILWNNKNITLKQITNSLKHTHWSYTTIRTLVNRLLEKGIIDADKTSASAFKYFPIALESECKQFEMKNFLSRVFNGSASMMITALVKDGNLSKKEIENLKSIIENMNGGELK